MAEKIEGKIGIIAAEEKEMAAIKELMSNLKNYQKYNLTFFEGNLCGREAVLVECGEGKVNAARTAQILLDSFENISEIINVGSAGAVNPELNIGDVIIAEKLVQYDFDISGLGYEKGEICNIGKYINSNKKLVEKCENLINSNGFEAVKKSEKTDFNDFKIKIGTVGTADRFCDDPELAKKVFKEFEADCVEMEGAAIAQVCYLDKIPFIVIRGISDTPNGNNKIDFRTYLEKASKQVALILKTIIEAEK